MDKNKCTSCGEAPHKCSCKNKDFTKAVIEIDNPEQITLMRKVVIPASMGDDTTVPPTVGKYHNVLLYYEANQKSYLYSSDGIPTQLVNGVTDYEAAINLPQINGNTLLGNKTGEELGLQDKLTAGDNITIENNVISATDTTYGPATDTEIGLVRPGDGLEVDANGTMSISDIEQYAHFFDTVADMKAATNLKTGDYARTGGFHAVNDGGGALYKITDTGTANEMDVIAIGSTLFAHLVPQNIMNVKQFGAKGDGTTDDTQYIIAMVDKCNYIDLGGFSCVIRSDVVIPDNCVIRNGIIKINNNGTKFNVTNSNSLLIENIEFQATYHKDNPSNDNNLFNISNSENITIRNCKINDACCGFNFVDCENIIVHDNEITGVSRFGFNFGTDNYTYGSIKNVEFYNNFMHDNPYIPLKFTGYIENIDVFGNTGFNNLDSEETACHSFKNCKIHDNVFHDDTNRNIGFKQLDTSEYPLPADAPPTLYAENVEIFNNSCIGASHNGINIQIYYDRTTKDIMIHDNTVISGNGTDFTGIRIGVLNTAVNKCCKIYNNLVDGKTNCLQGILLVNANHCEVYDNTVLDCVDSLIKISSANNMYTAYNLKSSYINIYNNKLESLTGSCRCVYFATTITGSTVDNDITNVSITHNNFNNNTSANQIQDKPSTAYVSQNYDGVNLYDTVPSRRSANFTIYYAKDPVTAGCIGWIATGGIVSPTYKQYIPIS